MATKDDDVIEVKAIQLADRGQGTAVMPIGDVSEAALRRARIIELMRSQAMRKDVDYGVIPGTKKPTLFKAGAETLLRFFGLRVTFEIEEKLLDWTGQETGGEPLFYFSFYCFVWSGDQLIAQGLGSCNSMEKKYRFRSASRVCPNCGAEAIIKGRQEYGGGWICFEKKGGCKSKWKDGDPIIEEQETGQTPNPEMPDVLNTVQKMAQKRALVQATLLATGASAIFTQDLEDGARVQPGDFIPEPAPFSTLKAIVEAYRSLPDAANFEDDRVLRSLFNQVLYKGAPYTPENAEAVLAAVQEKARSAA